MSDPAPLSKTAKYKKITKPLLERKRRARINRCLDELKDLMVGALEIDDDNLSKLEKADILELTVNHLTKLHSPKDPVLEAKKFQAGFGQCAAEACRFIMSVPELDTKVSQSLVSHLSRLITAQPLTIQVPERPSFSPPTSPISVASDRQNYYSDHERSSSDAEDSTYSGESPSWFHYLRMPEQPRANPPTTGLLTTVDKVPARSPEHVNVSGHRTGGYFNRVPAEAKDVILQKIRQHIMGKRGHDGDMAANAEPAEPKYLHKDEAYRGGYVSWEHAPVGHNNNATLDLRKVRSPSKPPAENCPQKPAAYHVTGHDTNQLAATPAESKAEAATLPEQCELPEDYTNLPPKKKRKLIEYQEFKKQEEARRQRDAFYTAQKDPERPSPELDADGNKWRPW